MLEEVVKMGTVEVEEEVEVAEVAATAAIDLACHALLQSPLSPIYFIIISENRMVTEVVVEIGGGGGAWRWWIPFSFRSISPIPFLHPANQSDEWQMIYKILSALGCSRTL